MGTSYSVKLPRVPEGVTSKEIQADIDALLVAINAEMSTYDPNSSLSLLNKAPAQQWLPIPPRLAAVLSAARDIYVLSDGLFDPTVGPLVNLWGFGPQEAVKLPDEGQVAAAMKRVGYDDLRIDSNAGKVSKASDSMYVDLSAIAKGFAVDEVAQLLERRGLTDYLIEIGGELRVQGRNPQGKPWRVAVESPIPGERQVHGILSLESGSVATSGDYRNFFTHEGQRFSHTIDPRTGYPVTHSMVSVTVVDASAMRADALATALLVMGPEAAMKLAINHELAIWMILEKEEQLTDLRSPAMDIYRVH